MSTKTLMVCLLAISLFFSQAFAAPPIQEFVFQGFLKGSTGAPFTGQKHVTLRIYTTATGGSAPANTGGVTCPSSSLTGCIWQENQTNIGFVNGIFTVNAGNQTSLNRVDFNKPLFLEIIIKNSNGGQEEILRPRVNLTAAPFALSSERGNFGYFNGTQFLINQTGTSDKKTVFNVTNMGIGTLVNLKSGATFNNILNITAGSLTTGSAINITSDSASPAYRNLVVINNNNTAADATSGLLIWQAGDAPALRIKSSSGGISSAGVLNITAGSLTSGSALNIASGSGSSAFRPLVNITNDNPSARGTVLLKLKQDANYDIIQATDADGLRSLTVDRSGFLGVGSQASNPRGILHVSDVADNTHLVINGSSVTFNNVINVTAGSLTRGSILNMTSGSGNPTYRNLVVINNNNTAADAALGLFINQAGDAPALSIKSTGAGKTNAGILNITAGGLMTGGSAFVLESTSGNAGTRNLVNMTNDNTAATGTTVLSLRQGSSGNILNVVNASGAETLKVSGTGLTTVTQLKVNTTGVTLRGIFMGTNTSVVTLGTNTITVTNADGNDAATCTFRSGFIAQNMDNKNFFVTVGNVTTDKVFVNVTYSGSGVYNRAPFPLNCIVFDLP
ncbi:MAG: hypothetical protein ACT4OW_05085 [Nitrososphaerota archaeon]